MNPEFPPVTRRVHEVSSMIEMFGAISSGRTLLYASVPITSGWRYYEWRQRRGPETPEIDEELRKEVIVPNRRIAAEFVRSLRDRHSIVVDPSAVPDQEGWLQSDWRDLWARVIRRFVEALCLVDGWEASNGCTYEVLVANKARVPVLDSQEVPIRLPQACERIRAAAARIELKIGITPAFLVRVVEQLEALE